MRKSEYTGIEVENKTFRLENFHMNFSTFDYCKYVRVLFASQTLDLMTLTEIDIGTAAAAPPGYSTVQKRNIQENVFYSNRMGV